jgi:hypothetical protein
MIKALLRYGAAAEDQRCINLCGALRAIHFPHGNKEVRRIDGAQADAIRAVAHKMKLPSLALAQAFQFDLKLYDGQIIGEWVPVTEPGESAIQTRTIVWRWGTKGSRPSKWLRGLQWSQIDEDYTLRHEVNGKIVKVDLRRHPRIMAELKKFSPLPKSGPLIVYEKTGSPYADGQYRSLWREAATKAGVPPKVRNVTGNSQDTPPSRRNKLTDEEIRSKVAALCERVPLQIRKAICDEIIADLALGEIALDDVQKSLPQYVNRHYAAFSNRFKEVSLDQPLRGTEGLRLGDTLSSEDGLGRD